MWNKEYTVIIKEKRRYTNETKRNGNEDFRGYRLYVDDKGYN